MMGLQPEYISDIVMKAMDDGQMKVLTPIINKYDKLYKGKSLMGQTYHDYVDGIFTEYIEATKSGNL